MKMKLDVGYLSSAFIVACVHLICTDAFTFLPAGHRLASKGHNTPQIPIRMSTTTATPEEFKFESNVARVMDIIINSLYSNKDVFLRELVSNAADACDKKRFTALTSGADTSDLKIRVYPNRELNTLTIEDSGIGMSKEDLIQNLGKIAESGTKKFMENNQNKKDDLSLIGQFGVGFYSGFLVANKMTVVTKSAAGSQMRWEAEAESLDTYKISVDDSEPIANTGTRITLHLKDESDQYLDDVALKALLEKYSEFVQFPIELQRQVTKPEQVPDTSKGADIFYQIFSSSEI